MEKVRSLGEALIVDPGREAGDAKLFQDLRALLNTHRTELSKDHMMLDFVEKLDSFWDSQAKAIASAKSRPFVGYQYDAPSQEDWDQLMKVFQKDFAAEAPEAEQERETKRAFAATRERLKGSSVLQEERKKMEDLDAMIDEALNAHAAEMSSQADDQDTLDGEVASTSKKRRVEVSVESEQKKSLSSLSLSPAPAQPAETVVEAPSISPTQVLFGFLQELQSVHFNYLDFARHYEPLRCCRLSGGSSTGAVPSNSDLQPLGQLLARETDCSLLQMEKTGVAPKAKSVAKEFVRYLAEHLQAFDAHSAMAQSLHKQTRRRESLCFSPSLPPQIDDILQIYDRVPNPFSSAGPEASQWLWLSSSAPVDDSSSVSSSSQSAPLSRSVCRSLTSALDFSLLAAPHNTDQKVEHKESGTDVPPPPVPQPLAHTHSTERESEREQRRTALTQSAESLYLSLQRDNDLLSLHRRSATKQTLSVLACGLGACLCVRDSEAGRDTAALRRALLACYVVTQQLERERDSHKERDGCCPLLVLCKARDLEIWESALSAAAKHSPIGMQVLPYWGNDADRASARAYLRTPVGRGPLCVLCSYETLCVDVHLLRELSLSFSLCVCDEPWGLLSVAQYAPAAVAAVLSLRARQRLLVCSEIARSRVIVSSGAATAQSLSQPSLASENENVTESNNDSNGENEVISLGSSVPDPLCALLALCPFALGVSPAHTLTHTLTQQEDAHWCERALCASLSLSQISITLPHMRERDAHAQAHKERVDCDVSARCMAARLAAALTVLCDADLASLAESLSLTRLAHRETESEKDPQARKETEIDAESESQRVSQERVMCVDELNSLCLVLSALEWRGVERTYGVSEEEEDEMTEGDIKGKKIQSREKKENVYSFEKTRSELFNSVRFIVRDCEFSHDFRDPELDEELQQIVWTSVGKSGTLQRVRDKGAPTLGVQGGAGRGGSASGRGAGRGRGGRGGRGRGRGDISEHTQTADMMDVAEGELPESLSSPAPPEAETERETRGTTGRGRGGAGRGGRGATGRRAASLAVSAVVAAAEREDEREKDPLPSLSLEEERARYVVNRAGLWHANIITLGRQRCLGVFTEEWEAYEVFRVAHAQREALRRLLGPKHRARTPREVKLTDGSNIAADYYRQLSDEALQEEIRNILLPQQAIKMSLTQWIAATYHAPPSYAQLCGPQPQSLCVTLDDLHVFLGRCEDDNDEENEQYKPPARTLLQVLGAEENALERGFALARSPRVVHISRDRSVARTHARIDWESDRDRFMLRAISAAGVFVNGKHVRPCDPAEPLRHKSVLQVGCVNFYFLLPLPVPHYTCDEPLALRRDIVRSLGANLQLRQRVFTTENLDRPSSVVELERDITSAMRNIEEKEALVVKRFLDGATKSRRAVAQTTTQAPRSAAKAAVVSTTPSIGKPAQTQQTQQTQSTPVATPGAAMADEEDEEMAENDALGDEDDEVAAGR